MISATMAASSDYTINALLDQARESSDPYQSAALHPWLGALGQAVCEKIIFVRRRYPRLFAQAAYTPVSLLHRLAQESDPVTLNKLVKNSATPAPVLKQLARGDDGEQRLNSIAAHPNASAALLDSLDEQASPTRRRFICSNPNTGLLQLNRLLESATLQDRKGMAQNPQADAKLLRKLWQADDDKYLRSEIAAHRNCPDDLLDLAVASGITLLRRKAATNAGLSERQMLRLLADSEAQVRAAALRYLGATNVSLADEPARRVRRELARKAGLDDALIKRLSADEDTWVRRWVARNPATGETVLRKLAEDAETEVRRGVARNPFTPTDLCRQLAVDEEFWVRAGIAIRSDLDRRIIARLATDDSIDVLAGLGHNPKTPHKLLAQIAAHRNRDVRRAVILNQQAPPQVLTELQQDPYPLNRAMLCRHPALGEDELWDLTGDPEAQVRFNAVQVLASRCVACD
jgi:hypothetical protein